MIYRKRRRLQNQINIFEAPFDFDGQSQKELDKQKVIKSQNKENNAKMALMEMEQFEPSSNLCRRNNNTKIVSINGWIPNQLDHLRNNSALKENKNKKNNTTMLKTYQWTQSIIPKLKNLLIQLQSPKNSLENRRKQLRIQFLKQINQKRRQSFKIADLIKVSMNSRKSDRSIQKPFFSQRCSQTNSREKRNMYTSQDDKNKMQIQMHNIKEARKKRTLKNLLT